MAEDSALESIGTAVDSGFLELETMGSMQRLGDSQAGTAFIEGGSTLLDLDGLSEEAAKKAAVEHRQELSHGHHLSERYKVLNEIARGGMGAVLEVHDSDLDRRVAMKVLLRDTRQERTDSGSATESGPVNRFIGEAQLTGSLEHPNIVPVHELGLDSEGRIYFTMKRVKGRSLRQIMDRLRQGHVPTLTEFSRGKLLGILLKICDAIELAHSRDIVHRDLKPENIMVGQFGEVLVMDWGLAKQVKRGIRTDSTRNQAPRKADSHVYHLDVSLGAMDADSRQTREGTISGTPAYMAPEQAQGRIEDISPRTDIFCLGGILYEFLCLSPPFLAPTTSMALSQARDHRLLSPRAKLEQVLKDEKLARAFGTRGIERGRKYPRELAAVAMRAMAEKREHRYHSVEDLKRDIENYISAEPVSAYRDNPFVAINKWARRNPTRAAVLVLVMFFVLVGGVVAAGVKAKMADDAADAAEVLQQSETEAKRQSEQRLAAEAKARKQAERAQAEAERASRLEKEKADRERKQAERMQARRNAFVPYSAATDLRTRSATFADYNMRAETWRQAVVWFQQAIALDPTFKEAHIELAQVYADLGFDDDALEHFARADSINAAETGRGHVEALMSYAMYDFQRKVLSEGLSGNFDEVFRRFEPVRDAAEPGSMHAELAEILLDLGEAYRTASPLDFIRERDAVGVRLAKIEKNGAPLWEVYTLLAIFDDGPGTGRPKFRRRGYLKKARALKPNLPILTWLEIRHIGRSEVKLDRIGVQLWDKFIKAYPYDPRGYFSRALLRFTSETERDPKAEISDLRKAIELNPRYAEAHKLLLSIHAREGEFSAAMQHIRRMRASSSGLDTAAINLIEVELTASTGEFERLRDLVISGLQERRADGIRSLGEAGRVLLRDHEYNELVTLCDAVMHRMGDDTPPLTRLLLGRGLTMKGEFDDAMAVFSVLEEAPRVLPPEWRATLAGWAEDARAYPVMLAGTSFPDARHSFDLARILAANGADPRRWLPMIDPRSAKPSDVIAQMQPADYVLRAIGLARLAGETRGTASRSHRFLAVEALATAFEEGYLNRGRVLRHELLAPLVTDPKLEKYFKVR